MSETNSAPEPSFREQVESATAQEAPAPEPVAQETQTQDESAPAEQAPEPGEQEKVEKVVPLAALHDEREQKKVLRRQNEELQRNFAALQRQQAEILATLQKATTPQQASIDPQADPWGHMLQQTQQTREEIAQMRQAQQQEQQRTAQQQHMQAIQSNVSALESQFAAQNKDYFQAVQYLRSVKQSEYVAAGMDEDAALEAVKRDAWLLAQDSLQKGVNPAERAYNIAKALRYQGGTPASADKIAMQQAGQKASTPNAGAGQGGGRISLEALAKMSPDEFLKATSGNKWKRLMQNAG